jgi:hypothetical protein
MLIRRVNWLYAALAGASLTVALLSKVTMLLVWPVPALAWILLGTKKHLPWRKAIPLLGAYSVGLALASPVIVYSYLYSDLGARQVENRTQIDIAIPALLLRNARQLFESTRIYVGLPVLLWLGAALVVGIIWRKRKGTLFLLGAAALPIAALMAVGTRNDTRYYLVGFPPLLALMGIGGTLIWLWLRDVLSDRMPQVGCRVLALFQPHLC